MRGLLTARDKLARGLWANPGGNIALALGWGGIILGFVFCTSGWGIAVSVAIGLAVSWPGSETASGFARRLGMEWNSPPKKRSR